MRLVHFIKQRTYTGVKNNYAKTKFIFLYIFIILIAPFSLLGQSNPDSILTGVNNTYFEKKDTLLNIKFGIYNLDERFEITGSGFHYKIQPNVTLKTKFFFNYRFLSVAFAFAPKFIPGNNDDELKGKTKTFTFNLNLITKYWIQDLQYNHIKGFYLSNSVDYEPPDWEEGKDPYFQFPDLKTYSIRGATSYKFNPEFSLRAVRTQTEVQTKSAGSFMPSLIYSYYLINNESSDTSQSSSQRSDNFEVLVGIWYMHTFVINKKWSFSLGLAPSAGFGHTKLNTRIESEHFISYYNEPLLRLNEVIGLNYNNKRFFTGFFVSASQTRQSQGDNPVIQNNFQTTFQIFAGYRFNAPKFLKKSLGSVKGKLGK